MKKNELPNLLKNISLMFIIAFAITACDNNKGKQKQDKVPEPESTISILPHTPETLQEYNNDVATYNAVANKQHSVHFQKER